MPKYLMFDHGGVLDGEYSDTFDSNNDLVLKHLSEGGYMILKNGVNIVNQMNDLVGLGYEVVFHSKNVEEAQIEVLEQLQQACKSKGVIFPNVTAMAVRDQNKYQHVASDQPKFAYNSKHHILIAGYDHEQDGKACVRNALTSLLMINDKSNHYVFDDVEEVYLSAKNEGYQSVHVKSAQDIGQALNGIFQNELNNKPPSHSHGFFAHEDASSSTQDSDYQAIKKLKSKIDKELASSLCSQREVKIHKSKFLAEILNEYHRSDNLSLREGGKLSIAQCINKLKNKYPRNYEIAISGKLSKRTKKTFEAILAKQNTPRLS